MSKGNEQKVQAEQAAQQKSSIVAINISMDMTTGQMQMSYPVGGPGGPAVVVGVLELAKAQMLTQASANAAARQRILGGVPPAVPGLKGG